MKGGTVEYNLSLIKLTKPTDFLVNFRTITLIILEMIIFKHLLL